MQRTVHLGGGAHVVTASVLFFKTMSLACTCPDVRPECDSQSDNGSSNLLASREFLPNGG